MPTTRTEPEILRTNDVLARLNVSRSSLHRRRQNGTFPKPFQLGKHAVGWRRADIDAWLADRPVSAHNSVVGADQGFRAPSGD